MKIKHVIAFWVLLFAVTGTYAQSGTWKRKINAVQEDYGKLVKLIDLINAEKNAEEKESQIIYGMELAGRLKNDSLQGKMYMLRAFEQQSVGRLNETWADLQRARLLFIKSGSVHLQIRTISSQARVLLLKDLPDSVISFLNRNKALVEAGNNVKLKLAFLQAYPAAYKHLGMYELAKEKYREIIAISGSIGDTDMTCAAYINLGHLQDETDSAMYWFRKVIQLVGRQNAYYPEVMMNIGFVYLHSDGKLRDSALYYLKEAERYEHNLSLTIFKSDLHNTLGSYFFSKGEYRLALDDFFKAKSLNKEEDKRSNMVLNNIALCYMRLNKADSAIKYLRQFENVMARRGGDHYEKLLYHQSKGIYAGLISGDTCAAEVTKENLMALSFAEKLGDTRLGAELLFMLLDCNLEQGARTNSMFARQTLAFCVTFYPLLKQDGNLFNYSYFLTRYAQLEALYGSKEKAINLFVEYADVVQRMQEKHYMDGMNEAMVKYKSELKDAEINLLNQKEKSASLRMWFIGAGLILVSAVLVLIYILYRRESKSKKMLDERNHKVEQLLREVHHRVKNNLQIVSSFINIQLDKVTDDKASDALLDTSTRIMALAGLHQSLYRQDDLSRIQLKEYIEDLCKSIGHTISDRVLIRCDLEKLSLDIDQAIPVGLAVNEMITNALKHAFGGMPNGQIDVTLHQKDKWVLTVKDNGKGVPDNLDPDQLQSIGIRLVQDLAEHQLKGRFSFYNEGGAVFKIEFTPLAA